MRYKTGVAELHLSPDCFKAALTAPSLSIQAARDGNFAAVRPPGHHAHREKASGFCLFNNIAVATQYLLNKGKKVAILDIDGHHGDGTQSIFKKNTNVFFCSIHQKDVFPGSGTRSDINYFNIPLTPPITEKVYLDALRQCIEKIHSFSPDTVGVSVGLDTYKKDNLLDFDLGIESYKKIGQKLRKEFVDIFAILEGGYHDDIKECIESFVEGISHS